MGGEETHRSRDAITRGDKHVLITTSTFILFYTLQRGTTIADGEQKASTLDSSVACSLMTPDAICSLMRQIIVMASECQVRLKSSHILPVNTADWLMMRMGRDTLCLVLINQVDQHSTRKTRYCTLNWKLLWLTTLFSAVNSMVEIGCDKWIGWVRLIVVKSTCMLAEVCFDCVLVLCIVIGYVFLFGEIAHKRVH